MPGLYIHIPFCKQKCRYCDFPSYAGAENQIAAYLHALKQEISAKQAAFHAPLFASIFFGGGTPSILPEGVVADLMETIKTAFPIAEDAEVSIECNPGTASEQKLKEYRKAGINRLSIGLQSADDRLLQRIGRIHDCSTFEHTFSAARTAGFENINVDLMHGLPGQNTEDYIHTLEYICALEPEHISAYGLILEEGTPLYRDVMCGDEILPDEDLVADMQDAGIQYLKTQGYERYEVSNFAKQGFRCRHNINYWENGPYLGFGAGAHSAWRVDGYWQRFENNRELPSYIHHAADAPEMQIIPAGEEMFETVMMGLRKTDGLSLDAFLARFGMSFCSAFPKTTKALCEQGLLHIAEQRAYLTEKGLDLQNTALIQFLEENSAERPN